MLLLFCDIIFIVAFAGRRECLCSCMLCSTISRDLTCLEHCNPLNFLATLSLPAMSFSWCSELCHLPLLSNSSATSTSTLRWTKISFCDSTIFRFVKLVAEVNLCCLKWLVASVRLDGPKVHSMPNFIQHIVNMYALCFFTFNVLLFCENYITKVLPKCENQSFH